MGRKPKYDPSTFIGSYIESCKLSGHPLDKTQLRLLVQDVNLLEKTVTRLFGLKNNSKLVKQPLDEALMRQISSEFRYASPNVIFDMLREYRSKTRYTEEHIDLSDDDVLAIYNNASRNLHPDRLAGLPLASGFAILKKQHGLPKTLDTINYYILRDYLIAKKVIKDTKPPHWPSQYL